MFDPVYAEDGLTYEREAIMDWLDTHDTSPMLRDPATGAFKKIGKTLRPNRVRKAALKKLCRNRPEHVDESSEEEYVEVVEWDASGLQEVPPTHSKENARSLPLVVKPPANHPTRAGSITANMTSDLCKMFKALDPVRNELDYVGLTPPKIVVIGDESSGKSSLLEQLIRMPLFPRHRTFCTRLPIHVRLRRPEEGDTACVTMSVISSTEGRELQRPETIATASGYHFVRDKMDELISDVHDAFAMNADETGGTGGVVTDKIIVLDVLHPEVPVLDLIDMPGIVAVDNAERPGRRAAVESILSSQIDADEQAGTTSFYLVVVPSGGRPNANGALKFIEQKELLDRAIGVFTKSDEVAHPEDLRAFITGESYLDDERKIITPQALGNVHLGKGWTPTMLAMPKRLVTNPDTGELVNYYTFHATERLEKQKEDELSFFGGTDANEVMRDLYDRGLAGTGALQAKLTREYLGYTRTEWLEKTMKRLLEYLLELKANRAMLGQPNESADSALATDVLAKSEVVGTLDAGAQLLSERFCKEVLLGKTVNGEGVPTSAFVPNVKALISTLDRNNIPAEDLDDTLNKFRREIELAVAIEVKKVTSFYADELVKMLRAQVMIAPQGTATDSQHLGYAVPAEGPLNTRFWEMKKFPMVIDKLPLAGSKPWPWEAMAEGETILLRSLFGTATALPLEGVDLHKKILETPFVQLGHYPAFIDAVANVVRAECVEASRKIQKAAATIVEKLTDDGASPYLHTTPNGEYLQNVKVHFVETNSSGFDPQASTVLVDALTTAFVRYVPSSKRLVNLVSRAMTLASDDHLRLSCFEEIKEKREERMALDERIARVRTAIKGLIAALDIDGSEPLDGTWLHQLQEKNDLPTDPYLSALLDPYVSALFRPC